MSSSTRPLPSSTTDLEFSDNEASQTEENTDVSTGLSSTSSSATASTSGKKNKKNKKGKDTNAAPTGKRYIVESIDTTSTQVAKSQPTFDPSNFGPSSLNNNSTNINHNNHIDDHNNNDNNILRANSSPSSLSAFASSSPSLSAFASSIDHDTHFESSSNPSTRPAAMPKVTTLRDALGQTLTPNKTTVAVATLTTTAGIALTLAGGVVADKANQFLSTIAPKLTPDSDEANAVADAQNKLNQVGPMLLISAQVLAALNVVPSAVRSFGWSQLTKRVNAETTLKTILYNMDAILGRLTQGAGVALITKGIIDQQNGDSIYGTAETIVGLGALKVGTGLANLNFNKRNWMHGRNNQRLFHNAKDQNAHENEHLTSVTVELGDGAPRPTMVKSIN